MSVVCNISFDCMVSVEVEASGMRWICKYTRLPSEIPKNHSLGTCTCRVFTSDFTVRGEMSQKAPAVVRSFRNTLSSAVFPVCVSLAFPQHRGGGPWLALEGRYSCLPCWVELSEQLSAATTIFRSSKEGDSF